MGMKVEGLDNALRNMKQLEPKKWRRMAMKELRDSQKEVRSYMRAEAPVNTGKLRRSIRTKAWAKRRSNGELSLFIATGPRTFGKGKVWYAHLAELNKSGGYIARTWSKFTKQVDRHVDDVVKKLTRKANGL